VVSTVTGRGLSEGDDVRSLLVQQLTQPVRFAQALASAPDVDLWLEVGPGRVLAGVAAGQTDTPVVALDASSDALAGLLHACGAAFALGTTVRLDRLFAARFARPFDVDWQPRFFVNPCEMAPESAASPLSEPAATPGAGAEAPPPAAGREDPLSVFREIVAQHLELPIELVSEASHLLTDLHLNSITVGQLVGQACRRLGLPGPGAATEYATASVGEVGQALVELRRLSDGATFAPEPVPDGIDAWVRAFELEWIEQPLEPASANTSRGRWSLFAPDDHPLAAALRAAFATAPGSGAVVCMPVSLVQCNVGDLLAGARVALDRDVERLVIVQHSAGHPGAPPGGGFAKTVHLEAPRVAVRVVDVPFDHPDAVRWILAEAVGAGGFAEARYDTAGRRTEPRLRLLRAAHGEAAPTPLTSADVVLVTGGGKGIAAECALALAKRSGVRLAILGRSSPDADADLAHNLARLREAGAIVHYAAADVCDATAVRAAVDAAQAALGPITAIVHGAGTNVPQPVLALDEAACIRTLQPKVQGLQNVLQAVQPERLRHLVTFSSIIGRMGLAGEADYALANEWLSSLTRRFAIEYPRCHCLALEWSVWSGAGMGQRLGRMDALLQRGVTPIAVEPGVEALLDLMSRPVSDPVVVVSGRFGTPATLRLQSSEPPLLRFVEKSRVQYPGVELVVDVELSGRTDPYVDEHVYQRQPLFPAVMGLEAMLQVASSLAEDDRLPVLENVQLQRPIVVPPRGSQRIQIAALVREPGCVDVAVRCADTSFKLDHFRATCRFGAAAAPRQTAFATGNGGADIEPQRDLYDAGVLFHQGRFQRIAAYELLCAQECRARLNVRPSRAWFAGFMPDRLLLGDAAARDAAIHAIQACIPHERVLPVGVERILPGRLDQRAARVRARERQRARGSFVYDLEILDADGRVLESWDGLHLKTIEPLPARQSWPAPLLAAYVERRVAEFMPHSGVQVALEHDRGADRQASSQHAVDVAVGSSAPLVRRPDGKPELAGHGSGGNGSAGDGLAGHDLEGNGRTGNGGANRGVSVSHAGGLTFAVVGHGPVGCDIEPVTHRSLAAWNDVCGERHMQLANLVARESREDIDTAATRVWVALESLKKAGVPADAPVLIDAAQPGGDVTFTCGRWTAATQVASIGSDPMRLAVCVVAGAAEPGPDR
jgi:enediyne polyketide synthase